MRILHLGKYYAPERGGIERYTQALAEWCVENDDAVSVLVHRKPGVWQRAHECIGGVDVRRAGCIAAPLYTPLSPLYPFELARALREFRPDVLHLHFPNPSCFAALMSPMARRVPWLVHWHADVPPDAPDWRLRSAYRVYRIFERAMLQRTAAIIATSQPYLDASVALQPWRAKTRVVPLGVADVATTVDLQPFESWQTAAGLRLLAVGRLSHYKGFDGLIEALAHIPEANLLLVGDGECASELKALAETRGVATRITLAGNLDDATLAAAYANAHALVLPSRNRSEAFGLVLLEAMRAGLAVIASAIPGSGIRTVVVDGQTGLLVPPNDVAALAAAIDRLHDAAFRSELGDAGRARWACEFTLQRSAQAIRSLYQTLR